MCVCLTSCFGVSDSRAHTSFSHHPRSGFRQKPATHHLRFAFLPPEDDIRAVIDLLKSFHAGFMKEFAEE